MGPGHAAGEGEPSDGRQEMHLSSAHCDGNLGRGTGGDWRLQTGASASQVLSFLLKKIRWTDGDWRRRRPPEPQSMDGA